MIDKRKTPELNASSMADIAFLLLIFFLVVTTMNVDTGLNRMLPPMPEKDQEEAQIDMKKRNLMLVMVSKDDYIMVGDERGVSISDLKERAKKFILNAYDEETLPEKEIIKINTPGGVWEYPQSKGVISLQNDRGTSYDMYIKVQNELTRAFNEVRDQVAMAKFGKKFTELGKEESEAVQKAVPLKISEAEPRNIEGGK
jgi:biopolymer transport protein ExbD